MFDAKSILEQLMRGAQPPPSASRGGEAGGNNGMPDLGDLLRQFTEGGNRQQSQTPSGQAGGMRELPTSSGQQGSGGSGNILEDLLRQFAPNDTSNSTPNAGTKPSGSSTGSALEDLLRDFTRNKSTPTGSQGSGRGVSMPNAAPGAGSGPGAAGGLDDLLGQIFGRDGSAAPGETGKAGPQDQMREILEKIGASGPAASDMMRQLSDFIGNNKVGAGAALGGLGALIFGTRTGRSIAMSAAKVGAMAVVGGLAYKAYQNYSQGRPLIASGSIEPEAAPTGSGFEADQVSQKAALTYVRGMIAAAASDGRIDANEQQQIIGSLSQQGLDAEAEAFLANELNNPASIDELVNGVSNDTESLQLYTAARLSIEPDQAAEQRFLTVLADRLGIAPELRAHVDAASRSLA